MPAAANKNPGDVILASEWNTLATTANNGESTAAAATTTANNANTAVSAKYTKPALGIPVTDHVSAVQTVLNQALVVSTSTTRPAVTNAVLFTTATDPGTNATAGKDFWIGDVAP